jgi:hypothetical protein
MTYSWATLSAYPRSWSRPSRRLAGELQRLGHALTFDAGILAVWGR